MKTKNIKIFAYILIVCSVAFVTIDGYIYPEWDHSPSEMIVDMMNGNTAYVALGGGGEMHFVLVTNSPSISGKIEVNSDLSHRTYARSGSWQDASGVQWKVLHSVRGDNSLTINDRKYILRFGRIFLLDSDKGVIQYDDSKFGIDKNITADQIQQVIAGDGIEEEKGTVPYNRD